ncbi:MAG: FAD-dependent monooxygenase [Deltaproteobacteria bacterium]|nr:FAD-dependent monooxygenase [Deltaproteobacteria bacterium]
MKIGIVGGGPAGLYFALLMKNLSPAHEIKLLEQNPADATYGWGVVFSDRAVSFLEQIDRDSYLDIKSSLESWNELVIVHKGQPVPIDGSVFSGISRIQLLRILQEHCRRRGIDLRFETRVTDMDVFADCDLIVGADGVNSFVRQKYSDFFQPSLDVRTNKYIWYGTRRVFDALSLFFRQNRDEMFVGHAYRYSPTMSTFIVECDAATWEKAGFASMSDAESRAYCEKVFHNELGGHPLLSNKSMWIHFIVVRNRHWYHDNVVLIGDALRTVHFSIGSGTRTAFEDAIGLSAAFERHGEDVRAALQAFEKIRKPPADQLLRIAQKSLVWYENVRSLMHLDPMAFAYAYMMRGGKVSPESLRERAPKFFAAYEAYLACKKDQLPIRRGISLRREPCAGANRVLGEKRALLRWRNLPSASAAKNNPK